jgi:hypothetical protein
MGVDIVSNWRTTLAQCRWDLFFFKKDPFYFRVQMALFFPFMIYSIIVEIWMFFNSFTFRQIVVTHNVTIALNTIGFALLLCLDVLLPLILTFISIFIHRIQRRMRPQGESVFNLFKNPEVEAILIKFAQAEYSVENVLAYRDILEYKKQTNLTKSREHADKVYNTYLRGGDSIMELNIPLRVGIEVKQRLASGLLTEELFDGVEKCIATNLSDTISRLTFYPAYMDYVGFQKNVKIKKELLDNLGL